MFILLFVGLILFVFGLIIGSFLNVVIFRTLADESPMEGRSRCDQCRKQIAWYDNIPLLSYIILGGKCRYCKKPISISHPVLELLTGALFVWWYIGGFLVFRFFQLTAEPFHVIQPAFWLMVGIFLLVIFVTDWISYIIPDYAVFPLLVLVIIYRVALVASGIMRPIDLVYSIAATLVLTGFFFGLWWFTKGKGMGFGDVKYCIPMGLLLGWPKVVSGVMIAFISGAVVGVALIFLNKKTMKTTIPFGPFLVLGTVVALMYGDQLLKWYMNLLL